MNPATHGVITIMIALLIAALSIPLILRKVPMNHVYGVRFPQSFKSKEAWYEINRYGGKTLLISSFPILFSGVYGLIQRPDNYSVIATLVLIGSVASACLVSYAKARQFDHEKG